MNKESKNKMTPKLRFPEFKDADGWKKREIGDVFEVTRGNVLAMGLVKESYSEVTPYPVYSSQTKNSGLAGYYSEFLYEDAITWTTDGANAGDVNFRAGKFYCTNVCGVLINKAGYANNCIASLINSVSRKYVSYVGNPKLMNGVMSKIIIPVPSIKEQDKIAACLSSLDDLISAESQKLDVYKAHKKGLMQNLFPAEGKKVPKLRFSEFRNKGEWAEETFKDLFSFIGTNSFTRDNLNYDNGFVKNIHYGDIHTKFPTLFDIRKEIVPYVNSEITIDKIKSECYCIEGDMIFADASEDLEDVGKSIEIVFLNGEKLLSGMHTLMARQCEPKLIIGFGGHLFLSTKIRVQIQKEAQGAKVLGISPNRLSRIKICYPRNKKEQQKIADCLSFLDELIKEQGKKIEALKIHRIGLIQGLFPSINETNS